jgi:hypothetical protein
VSTVEPEVVVAKRRAKTDKKARVTTKTAVTGRFATAAPVRNKAASKRLAATLKDLGADSEVVEAAERG